MTFLEAVRTCFGKYATFQGRASRPEFWYFALFLFLASIAAGIADAALFGVPLDSNSGGGPVSALFGLATIVPWLAAGWRRMHDSGRSGLHILYPLIVMVGIVTFFGFTFGFNPAADAVFGQIEGVMIMIFGASLLVLLISPLLVIWWLTRPSESGTNRYGPNPHEVPT